VTTNAQETLGQFEKLAGGESIAKIIERAYKDGYYDCKYRGTTHSRQRNWAESVTKHNLDNLLTKLNGSEG